MIFQITKLYKKVQELFCQAEKLFSVEIWKMPECHFWADVMLGQPRVPASRASPAQKSTCLRVVYSKKLFKGYIFCFLGDSVARCIFEQFASETNLRKKRSGSFFIYCLPLFYLPH